jgi:hypothetical protein
MVVRDMVAAGVFEVVKEKNGQLEWARIWLLCSREDAVHGLPV